MNKTDQPMPEIHILDAQESLQKLSFDRGFAETLTDKDIGYHIYKLAEPLKPNEAMKMDFTVGWQAKGFEAGQTKPEFAYNGTFFDRGYFPVLGYSEAGEIGDENDRKDQKLPPQAEMPEPGDAKYMKKGLEYFTNNFGPYQFKQFRILEFPRYRQNQNQSAQAAF